jgi:hypothetical protein
VKNVKAGDGVLASVAMSECHVLCLKPALRLEWRGQDGQDEAEQCKHYALTLGDSLS